MANTVPHHLFNVIDRELKAGQTVHVYFNGNIIKLKSAALEHDQSLGIMEAVSTHDELFLIPLSAVNAIKLGQ